MNREKFPQQRWSAASGGGWELRWPFGGENPSAAKKVADALCRRKACGKAWNFHFSWQRERLKGTRGCCRHRREGSAPWGAALKALTRLCFLSLHCSLMPPVPPLPSSSECLITGTELTVCPHRPQNWSVSLLLCSGFSLVPVREGGWHVSKRRWDSGGWQKMCQGKWHYSLSYQHLLLCHRDNKRNCCSQRRPLRDWNITQVTVSWLLSKDSKTSVKEDDRKKRLQSIALQISQLAVILLCSELEGKEKNPDTLLFFIVGPGNLQSSSFNADPWTLQISRIVT